MDLKRKIQQLPQAPGVYQYFDKNGKLLYIGKAKNLKKRVKSYFRFAPFSPAPNLSPRIFKMVSEVANLEYILVESENDALILENSLIKQLKPKYNILLRDDKTYPYIYIDLDENFPRPKITRKVVKGKHIKYFGPFPNAAKDLLDSLYELFPLVQKSACIKGKKACLFYQLKKCLAPCEGKITKDEYRKIVDEALSHIHNKKLLLQKLEAKMIEYAKSMRFEEAAELRDRIKRIDSIEITSQIDLAKLQDYDIFVIEHNEQKAVIVRMFIREGKVISSAQNSIHIDQEKGFERDEAYKRALLEFYTTQTPFTTSTILVGQDFEEREELQELLSNRFQKKITITVPKRGEKKRLINLAKLNAVELLKKKETIDEVEQAIQKLFLLDSTPYRIEVFDNSHISGSIPVGAMIVYENGKFLKESYRHYNLNSTNEYDQMKDLLTKRAQSFHKNPPPDLWLIDGGETLRKLAKNILESVGIHIDVIAIAKEKIDAKAHRAKGRAKDILYSDHGKVELLPNDTRLLFLQKLRDEAHRFAITFHRKQRDKKSRQIKLLEAKGIGAAKVDKLLRYFGTFENIYNASVDELAQILNQKDAQTIKSIGK